MAVSARALVAAVLLVPLASRPAPATSPRPGCTGRYADTLSTMARAARERESRGAADWVYCLRATAVYERVSYRRGGRLAHEYVTKARHGTGFAYRRRGDETLIATNEHVVTFPEVTGDGDDVEGVPPGARRVRTEVRIVSNESEPESPSQPVLRVVLANETMDLAVLAARGPLAISPYPFGRSADLRVGDAVLARGYPLGAFPAANAGHVIDLSQRDVERRWDHDDFAVDALLNLGSSGSPVLAVSCETGEPEVVGIYHAGYRNAQGLNVVIALDQLRGMLDELRTPPARVAAAEPSTDPDEARAAVSRGPVLFPFGGRAVRAERVPGATRFSVYESSYPLSMRVELTVLDRGAATDGPPAELRSALWDQLALVLRYRAADSGRSRAPDQRERIAARLQRGEEEQQQLLAAVRAGADGFAQITRVDRDPAAQGGSTRGQDRPGELAVEVILGSR